MLKKTTVLASAVAMAMGMGPGQAAADIKIGVLVPDSGPAGLFGR